jgi:hypothetical protein
MRCTSRFLSRFFPAPRRTRRRRPAPGYRPQLEVLEARRLLAHFTVVLATDTGVPFGQKVTATSGDLRYCINQANAAHAAGTDTITFAPKVFAAFPTITLNESLALQDKNRLRILGPAAGVTISGGDQVGVFIITGGTVALRNLVITHGSAFGGGGTPAIGGGIYNVNGILTLTRCILDHNRAAQGGGGLDNGGTATLTGCTFSDDSGGGLDNGGTATLTGCTFSDDSGGGLDNGGTATLTNCTLSNDVATSFGGGIDNGGTATLTNCTLSNDSASQGGGGLFNSGTATLTGCTLSNDAVASGGNSGGGGLLNFDGAVTLTNCTLSHDSAVSGGGGGLENSLGTATLTNCTLSHNSAAKGGGIVNDPNSGGLTSTLNLTNTIIAGNTATGSDPDVAGVVTTADHELVGDVGDSSVLTNQGGNVVGGNGKPVLDPRLGPLQDNGGPRQTLALLPGSPARGHGDNAFAPRTDQRGVKRLDTLGEVTDIGAFEA